MVLSVFVNVLCVFLGASILSGGELGGGGWGDSCIYRLHPRLCSIKSGGIFLVVHTLSCHWCETQEKRGRNQGGEQSSFLSPPLGLAHCLAHVCHPVLPFLDGSPAILFRRCATLSSKPHSVPHRRRPPFHVPASVKLLILHLSGILSPSAAPT